MSSIVPPVAISLDALLPVKDGILTVAGNAVQDGTFADQLTRLTNSAPIVIIGAVRTVEANTVRVIGKTAFLNVPNLDVIATASIDANGPVVTLRFTLIGEFSTPDAWFFSRSFSNLPFFYVKVPGSGDQINKNFLDQLALSDAAFILTNAQNSEDPVTGASLVPGLNFVADCKPQGLLGLLETVATGASSIVISGQIIVPKPTEMTAPFVELPSLKFPWQLSQLPPGIHLKADLGVDKTLYNELRFHDMGLRIYCPLTQAWQDANPTYQPVLAASGRCDVPSAKISLDLTAIGITSTRYLTLFGVFEGVTLEKLESLIDLTGTRDLGVHLPDDVQKALAPLEQLSLEAIYVQFGKDFNIEMVGVAIGLEDLNTKVLPGFTVNNILANFMIANPFGTNREIGVELEGGITFLNTLFDITLDLPDVYAIAEMEESATIPLGTLFKQVSLPEPPNLSIDTLRLEVNKEGSYALSGSLADKPGWTLDLGPTTLTVSDVQFSASRPVSGDSSGGISGQIALGQDLIFGFNYQLPGDFVLRGQFPEVKLSELIGFLTNQALSLPSGFDLDFTDSAALIQKGASSLSFQLATTVNSLGTLAFEARRAPNSPAWGFALGVDFVNPRLSSLPGLGGLKIFEDLFNLDELEFVITSMDDPNFQFPSLAVFNNPVIPTQGVNLPQLKGGLIAGFNAYARWTLDTSKEQNLLRTLLGLNPSLAITLQIGENPDKESRLYVDYQTQLEGHPLDCQFGGQIENDMLSLFLKGDLTVDIQSQPTRFDVELLFVANGAFISGSMVGSVKFEGITLSNLALVIGTDWEGVPSLGIAATITDASFQSSLAVFFDSADPSQSMLAGAISNLSLRDVVDTFTRGTISEIDGLLSKIALVGTKAFKIDVSLAKALDNLQLTTIAAAFAQHGITLPTSSSQVLLIVVEPGQKWFLTSMNDMMHYELDKQADGILVSLEPQFYCVPKQTSVGAFKFDQGFFLNAGLQIFFLKGSAKILIKPSQGVAVDGSIDRIVIGTEKLFSLSSKDGQDGPKISAATFSQSDLPDPYKKPHFFLDTKLSLLGLERDMFIDLSSNGFQFDIDGDLMVGVKYELKGAFNSLKDLNVEGDIDLGIGKIDLGLLGSINIDTGVKGDLKVGVDGSSIFAKFSGSFSFAGQGFSLPDINLDVNASSLLNLLDMVEDAVKDALLSLFADIKKWLDFCARGLVTGIENTIQVLKDFYRLTGDAAAAVLKEAGYAVEQISAGLKATYQFTAEQVTTALKAAGYAADQIASGLKTAYQFTADQAIAALKAVGYGADQVMGGLKTAYGFTADQAAAALKAAGYAADQVAAGLKTAYQYTADQVLGALKGVGYAADQVALGLKNAYGFTADQVAAALKGVGYAADQVASGLKNAYHFTGEQVAQLLKGAGYVGEQVAAGLKAAYSLTADQAIALLKGAGYATEQIASGLKTAYAFTADQVGAALKTAGYAADQVASGLKAAYGMAADQMIAVLRGAGYAVDQLTSGLKTAYAFTAEQVGSALKAAGYAADQVATGLKNVYGLVADQAVALLKALAYGADQITTGLKNAYGFTADQVAAALKAAGYLADQVAQGLKNVYHFTGDQVTMVLKGAGYAADQVAAGLKLAYGFTADQVTAALKGVGYAADQIATGLKTAYGFTADQVGAALKAAGYAVDQVTSSLKSAYGFTADQAIAVLRGIGFGADQVASGLKTAYGFTADQATAAMKAAGYAADQVASGLKTAYGFTADQAVAALKGAGYVADQVAGGLKSAYGFTADQVATVMKNAGYAADQVANGLKTAYGFTMDQAAAALKGAGYVADQAANALKTAYGATVDAASDALRGVGYAADQVKDALSNAFGDVGGFFKGLGEKIGDKLNPTHW